MSSQMLFIKNPDENAEERYLCVDEDKAWVAKLKFVFENGDSYINLLGPLLTTHDANNTSGRQRYYPVPFLFRTEPERKAAAERADKMPPPEWWVRRRMAALSKFAGYAESDAA